MLAKNTSAEMPMSECRQKVDVVPIEALGHHQKLGSGETQSQCNLRSSLAWDSSFFTSPGVLDPDELMGTLNIRDVNSEFEMTTFKELMLIPCEPREDKSDGRGVSNVRTSMAWDSAFFTSPGVLDAEELCTVNVGLRRSADSSSPAVSESYSLASLEIDLFDDISTSGHNEPPFQFTKKMQSRTASKAQFSQLSSHKGEKVSAFSKQELSATRKVSLGTSYAASPGTKDNLQKMKLPVRCLRPGNTPSQHLTNLSPSLRTGASERISTAKSRTSGIKSKVTSSSQTHSVNSVGRRHSNQELQKSPSPILVTPPCRSPATKGCYQAIEHCSKSRTPPKLSSAVRSKPTSSCQTRAFSSVGRRYSYQQLEKSRSPRLVPPPCRSPVGRGPSQESEFNGSNKNTSSKSSLSVPSGQDLQPSGLRMPSPLLGFFDPEVIVSVPTKVSKSQLCSPRSGFILKATNSQTDSKTKENICSRKKLQQLKSGVSEVSEIMTRQGDKENKVT